MIRIGPAGSGLGNEKGMREVKAKGLDALEFEFVYSIYLRNDQASALRQLNNELGLALSIHAPYFINLASEENLKIHASMKRILSTCERAHHLGARYVVFHPAFYGKRTAHEVFSLVSDTIARMQETILDNGWDVLLAPETTGKQSQFGSVEELLQLVRKHKCSMTVDFAHLLARNGYIKYEELIGEIAELGHVHAHFSGINYGPKGERNHILTPKDEAKRLLEALEKAKTDITIINESPDPIGDAQMMKQVLAGLGR